MSQIQTYLGHYRTEKGEQNHQRYGKIDVWILGCFLPDGRILIFNMPDENAIRPFVMNRKNWLFCNAPNGAAASAWVYSIVGT